MNNKNKKIITDFINGKGYGFIVKNLNKSYRLTVEVIDYEIFIKDDDNHIRLDLHKLDKWWKSYFSKAIYTASINKKH